MYTRVECFIPLWTDAYYEVTETDTWRPWGNTIGRRPNGYAGWRTAPNEMWISKSLDCLSFPLVISKLINSVECEMRRRMSVLLVRTVCAIVTPIQVAL